MAPRTISGPWWHQGPARRPLLFCPEVSRGGARYHRTGEAGTWYASSRMRASWCELFRHFPGDEVDPFEVRRRAGRARATDLRVLDLTDAGVRSRLDVSEEELVGDDYTVCQELSDAARLAGFDGLLAPSAGLAGEVTLAVFFHAVDAGRVVEDTSRVQVPPLDLVPHLERVRPIPAVAAAFAAFRGRLHRLSYAQLRRRYRRR